MPLLGHLPELFGVLLIGLLVFGPKRMIDMGASLGKAVREMRDSLKDIPGLGGGDLRSFLQPDEPTPTPFTAAAPNVPMAPPAPTPAVKVAEPVGATTDGSAPPPAPSQPVPGASTVVEGTVERVVELRED